MVGDTLATGDNNSVSGVISDHSEAVAVNPPIDFTKPAHYNVGTGSEDAVCTPVINELLCFCSTKWT